MGGEMHDAVLRQLAALAHRFHLALGGAGAKAHLADIGADVAGDGAELVRRLGKRRLLADAATRSPARRAFRSAPRRRAGRTAPPRAARRSSGSSASRGRAWRIWRSGCRGRRAADCRSRSAAWSRRSDGRSRRSAFSDDTAGSTVMRMIAGEPGGGFVVAVRGRRGHQHLERQLRQRAGGHDAADACP